MHFKQTIDLIFGCTSPNSDIFGFPGSKERQKQAKIMALIAHVATLVQKSDFFDKNDLRSIDRYYHEELIQTPKAEILSTSGS